MDLQKTDAALTEAENFLGRCRAEAVESGAVYVGLFEEKEGVLREAFEVEGEPDGKFFVETKACEGEGCDDDDEAGDDETDDDDDETDDDEDGGDDDED